MDGISKQVILHLSLIPSIGPSVIHALFKYTNSQSSPERVYTYSAADWQKKGFSPKIAAALFNGLQNKRLLNDELLLLKQSQIDFITWFDLAYPEQLRHIHLPPVLLYYVGNLELLNGPHKRLAVVGSRNALPMLKEH